VGYCQYTGTFSRKSGNAVRDEKTALEKPRGRAESDRTMEPVELEDQMNNKSPRGLDNYRNS
jgi:hypothetical protein